MFYPRIDGSGSSTVFVNSKLNLLPKSHTDSVKLLVYCYGCHLRQLKHRNSEQGCPCVINSSPCVFTFHELRNPAMLQELLGLQQHLGTGESIMNSISDAALTLDFLYLCLIYNISCSLLFQWDDFRNANPMAMDWRL